MIQTATETDFTFYIQTEDNRINTSVASTQIRHLLKFTNDMDKSIHYVYGTAEDIKNRYTKFEVDYDAAASANVFAGSVDLSPAGYWKYEAYEVMWTGTVTVSLGYAPKTEDEVLEPVAADKGIVQGLVTKGKMYVAEKDGTAQVQYNQHPEPSGTNYIWYGQ
jgi:hypothetical protein